MRKAVMPFVLSVGLIAVWAAPAEAVSTRADYIAQADPICLATAQADAHALSGGVTDINKGRFKVAARKMRRAGVFFSAGVDQLAALERPPADASLLGSWIDSLRAQVPIANRFARALSHKQVKRIRRTASQLLIAEDKALALVDDYGFALCNQLGL
jgi:hypothetical protein